MPTTMSTSYSALSIHRIICEALLFFLFIGGCTPVVDATIVLSSSKNPVISGIYVRGVEYGHEKAYAQANGDLWLYSVDNGIDGYRWFIGDSVFSDGIIAYIDSWSSDPCRGISNDGYNVQARRTQKNHWMVWVGEDNGGFQRDEELTLQCNGMEPGGIDACNNQEQYGPCVELLGGVQMPVVMLGTAYISANHGAGADNPEVIEAPPAIEAAIDIGYQGLDLGSQLHPAYANEQLVGNILAARGGSTKRRQVFLETKLSPNEHGYNATLRGFQRSLRLLQTDTIDLYLIHHPQCLMKPDGEDCEGTWMDSWRAMERLLDIGATRAIGISNFDASLLTEFIEKGIARAPVAVIQNRADPLSPEDPDVVAICANLGIHYQAFSVLGRQWVVGPWAKYWKGKTKSGQHPVLDHPNIINIAERLSKEVTESAKEELRVLKERKEKEGDNNNNEKQKTEAEKVAERRIIEELEVDQLNIKITTAQVVLRWALQKGYMVVPKTSNIERLESNRRLFHFSLSEQDMEIINQLPQLPEEEL